MILYVYLNCTAPATNQPTLLYITIYLYYDTLLCYLLRSCLNFSYLFSLSHITLICGSIWDVLGSVLRSILGFILTLLGTSQRGPKTDSKSTPSQEGQNTVKRPREPRKPESTSKDGKRLLTENELMLKICPFSKIWSTRANAQTM